MAKDRIGSSKPEGPGLLQDGVWTAEKKKACVRWGLNLISCDRNEQRIITCQGSVYVILGGVMNQAYHWKLEAAFTAWSCRTSWGGEAEAEKSESVLFPKSMSHLSLRRWRLEWWLGLTLGFGSRDPEEHKFEDTLFSVLL